MPSDDMGYVLSQTVPEGPLTARNLVDYLECPRKFMLSFFSTPADTGQFVGGPAALHRAVRAALIEFYVAEAGRRETTEDGEPIGGLESPTHRGIGGLESPPHQPAGATESPTHQPAGATESPTHQPAGATGGPTHQPAGATESPTHQPAGATGGPTQGSGQGVDLVQAFEEHWDGSLCKDSKEEEDLHRDGLLMLQRHVEAFSPPAAQWRCDARLEADFSGHRLVAVADVACFGPARFLRFSTSRRPPSAAELREDLPWAVLYLVARAQGDETAVATMVDLRRARMVDYALEPDERARMEARIAAVAGRIRQEREFAPARSKQCRWCRSRSQCPAWQGA